MRTQPPYPLLVLCTLMSISCGRTASPSGQAVLSAAVAVPTGSEAAVDMDAVPLGDGFGIYDPYERRLLGKQRWERDSFLQFLYHTPGTRHETAALSGPVKEDC